jgi:tRNA(His) guanylyltransferase
MWLTLKVRLSSHYQFTKPNDARALDLMNAAAQKVLTVIYDICFAYGVSDEYSFVFDRNTSLFERRRDKLISTVVSTFTAAYIHLWSEHFCKPSKENWDNATGLDVDWLPTFDARAVAYPTTQNLRDYLSWRQVDCHINNLYNTTFWAMVQQGGMTPTEAEEELKGTVAAGKNEILFSRFGINYNNEDEMYKKGSMVFREYAQPGEQGMTLGADSYTTGSERSKTQQEKQRKAKAKAEVVVKHLDIIKDSFWEQRPWLLGGKAKGC